MPASGRAEVALSYQLLWNPQRQIHTALLWLNPSAGGTPDVRAIASLIEPLGQRAGQPLLLCSPSTALLAELLEALPAQAAQLVVTDAQLQEPAIGTRVVRAAQRGLQLVWQGEPGTQVKPAWSACFGHSLRALSSDEALVGLRLARRSKSSAPRLTSPVHPGDWVEGVASRALAQHCLDQQGAGALLGWPGDDVLFTLRHKRIGPDRQLLTQALKALDADAPMEQLESLLAHDPLLVYRLLRYTNSAGLGLGREVDSLRLGLMVLGQRNLAAWLTTMRNGASDEPDLRPIRQSLALRAHLMGELLDSGDADPLRRELILCGLLSGVDLLLDEPMTVALHGMPLPQRVSAALLQHRGPYWPYLDVAQSLEAPPTDTAALCARYGFSTHSVNLAVVRTLAHFWPGAA